MIVKVFYFVATIILLTDAAATCIEYRFGSSFFACCYNTAGDSNQDCSPLATYQASRQNHKAEGYCNADNESWRASLPAQKFSCGNCTLQKLCSAKASQVTQLNSRKWINAFTTCCITYTDANIRIPRSKRECTNCTECANSTKSAAERANLGCKINYGDTSVEASAGKSLWHGFIIMHYAYCMMLFLQMMLIQHKLGSLLGL